MKKFFAVLMTMCVCTLASSAQTLYPINTQFAEMENGWYSTIDFDYSHQHTNLNAGGGLVNLDAAADVFKIADLDVRYTFSDRYRIGMNVPLTASFLELNGSLLGIPVGAERSAFGFGRLGLSLEAQIVENLNLYFDQNFPTAHSPLLDQDAYTFETGFNFQKTCPHDSYDITFFSELGYRYDDPHSFDSQHSFVYNNALVMDTHSFFNPFIELVGFTTFTDGPFERTNLRLVPGLITPFGDDNQYQFRLSMPIGLNTDSEDIGVQAGMYMNI